MLEPSAAWSGRALSILHGSRPAGAHAEPARIVHLAGLRPWMTVSRDPVLAPNRGRPLPRETTPDTARR